MHEPLGVPQGLPWGNHHARFCCPFDLPGMRQAINSCRWRFGSTREICRSGHRRSGLAAVAFFAVRALSHRGGVRPAMLHLYRADPCCADEQHARHYDPNRNTPQPPSLRQFLRLLQPRPSRRMSQLPTQ